MNPCDCGHSHGAHRGAIHASTPGPCRSCDCIGYRVTLVLPPDNFRDIVAAEIERAREEAAS